MAVVVGQCSGGGLDRVEVVGHRSVLGSSRSTTGGSRVRLLQLVEEVGVFGVVVRVDEAAVAQAAELELPERAVALQRLELFVELVADSPSTTAAARRSTLASSRRMRAMDGEQRLYSIRPRAVSGRLLEGGHASRLLRTAAEAEARRSATRSRTCGATSSMKVVSVCGSGGAASMKVLKPRSSAKCVSTSAQCSGGPTIGLVGVGGGALASFS